MATIKLPEGKEDGDTKKTYSAILKRKAVPTLYSSAYNDKLPAPTFENDFVEVKKSPVHGRGLFAKVDLKKNQQVARYVGESMTVKEYNEKYTPEQRHYFYSSRPTNTIIDGYKYKTVNPSHYMNESAHPNAVLKNFGVVVKSDPVHKGDELFLSYPKKYHREYKL